MDYCITSSVVAHYILDNSTGFSVTQITCNIVHVSLLFSLRYMIVYQAILKSQLWDHCSLIFLLMIYVT
jgi:hypothetical protein